MDAAPRWIGRLFLQPGRLVYAGAIAPTDMHAHHAFQVAVALAEPIAIAHEEGATIEARAAVIPPDAAHALVRATSSVVLLFVDPDDHAGRRLRRAVSAGGDAEAWRDAGAPLAGALSAEPATWGDAVAAEVRLLDALVGADVRPRPMHPGLARALRAIGDNLDGDVSLEAIAVHAELSPGRLSHLFSEELGIPLRAFVRWRRLMRAAESMQRGESITAAAHAGGFSDGAHMNHAFRRMFGIAPSDVQRFAEWVVAPK